MKRLIAAVLCAVMLAGWDPARAGTVTDAAGNEYETDDKGFLITEDDTACYILENEEEGQWAYSNNALSIRLERFDETKQVGKKTRKLIYWIADIYASEKEPMTHAGTPATKRHSVGYRQVKPAAIARDSHCVFAVSDDMYGLRLQKYKSPGLVIRDGAIISSRTNKGAKWPNLDTISLYADGSMRTHKNAEVTAEEEIEKGAVHVYCFGPVLISEGTINPKVLDPKYYPYNEPRVAIGMVEPYHYVIMCVKGRPTETYAGVHLDWLAQKMLDLGCVEALNLDGGGSVAISFMGKLLNVEEKNTRSVGSLISFGTDASIPAETEDEKNNKNYGK